MNETLLQETINIILKNNRNPGDVEFVTDGTHWCFWDEFAKNSDFIYDSGFGGNMINLQLKVVGYDWWLERHEYDGSEWWEYKERPKLPRVEGSFTTQPGDVEIKDSFYASNIY